MDFLADILGLLQSKQALFERYLDETAAMLDGSIDVLALQLETRSQIAQQIDLLDNRLADLAKDRPLLAAALKNKCNRGDLPPELLPVFDDAQSVFAVINQIVNLEPQILLRIQSNQKELEGRMKVANTKPKIAKYLDTLNPIPDSGTFLRAENSKV